jgi:hypothetical protein
MVSHVQDKNLEIVLDATPVGRTRNNLWAINLTPTEQATWFTDCYRLQINEVSKGSSRRSIYNPDSKAWGVWLDFFIFCRCAVLEGVLLKEMGWSWTNILNCAKLCLHKPFDVENATEKYGPQSCATFQPCEDRSLRFTAMVVTGESGQPGPAAGMARVLLDLFTTYYNKCKGNVSFPEMQAWLEAHAPVCYFEADEVVPGTLLQSMGGAAVWRSLFDTVKCSVDQCCGNPGCKKVGDKLCGACKTVRYCCATCQKQHWKSSHKSDCPGQNSAKVVELLPISEVIAHITAELEPCRILLRDKKFKEVQSIASKLLAFASVQHGEAVYGAHHYRRQGVDFEPNLVMHITIANIHRSLAGSYIETKIKQDIEKAAPFLAAAKQLLAPWRQHLANKLPMEINDKWKLVEAVISLDFLCITYCTFLGECAYGEAREYVSDACDVLNGTKDILPPGNLPFSGDTTVRIADCLSKLCQISMMAAEDEDKHIPLNRDVSMISKLQLVLEFCLEVYAASVGKRSVQYADCSLILVDVLLVIAERGGTAEFLRRTVAFAQEAHDYLVETKRDEEITGKAHYVLARCLFKCCEVLYVQKAKTNLPTLVSTATKHFLEAQRIYTRLYGDQFTVVKHSKDMAGWLQIMLK